MGIRCCKEFKAKNRKGRDGIFICEKDRGHEGPHGVPRYPHLEEMKVELTPRYSDLKEMKVEFTPYPKTPRLYRNVFITEKIDGTNAAINIVEGAAQIGDVDGTTVGHISTEYHTVFAQSRKRLITPKDDNFGFARWVDENAEVLVRILGPGIHFGEWWGSGIQRGYGLEKGEKRFSIFNVGRWDQYHGKTPLSPEAAKIGLDTVPVLYEGRFSQAAIDGACDLLREHGSQAAPDFRPAEGVVVYHVDAGQAFKVLLENDDISKTEAKK